MMYRILLGLIAALLLQGPASAQDYSIGKIKVSEVWTRVPPQASKVGGGFMTITNTGTTADTLIGGTASISNSFEVHEMAMINGVMSMRELKPGLAIKPGETVVLKPGSFHVMFIDLKEMPAIDKPVKGTLVFEKAGKLSIEYKVVPMGGSMPKGH